MELWDVALWIVLALVGVNLLLRVMLKFREIWLDRVQAEIELSRKQAGKKVRPEEKSNESSSP